MSDNNNIQQKLKNEESINIEHNTSEEEVNIYQNQCGRIKIHCMYDCIDTTPWISTDH